MVDTAARRQPRDPRLCFPEPSPLSPRDVAKPLGTGTLRVDCCIPEDPTSHFQERLA
jgi:hypothetical protein